MSDRALKEAVQKLAGTHLKDEIHMCDATVKSVNQMERTCVCTPIGGKAVTDLGNVLLMTEVDDGFLKIPAIGSTVRVQWSTRNVPYITMWSQLQKVLLVTLDGIQLQGGELGGLVKLLDLLDKLNILEADLNTIKDAFSTWIPVPNDGGSALKAITSTWAGDTITETTREDLENTSVTQGV